MLPAAVKSSSSRFNPASICYLVLSFDKRTAISTVHLPGLQMSQPALPSVRRKQRYNTLDFPRESRVPRNRQFLWILRAKGNLSPLDPPGKGERRSPFWLSKKWLAPLFRGVHSSLAPTARPGSYAEKPLLRKAFCGFAVHAAKSDYSLRGLRPPNPQGFFDRLKGERRSPLKFPCQQGQCATLLDDAEQSQRFL